MDPDYWQNPEEFRPERFITSEGKLRKEEKLIPFGKGKRMCIGESLAKVTTFIFLSSMIQKFKFKFDPNLPKPTTEGVPGFTLAAPYFKVIATARN
ncbi:Farnesoate epoxidase [Armadillidium vulgare]|nr:Farnesoate epoxidase [Armadillidium vulgare]